MSMRVFEKMTYEVPTVDEAASLGAAIDALRARHVRHLCVLREGKLVGIVCDRDIKQALPAFTEGSSPFAASLEAVKVSEVMSKEPITVASDESMDEAVKLMMRHMVSVLPVLDGDKIVGLLTETDCMRALLDLLDPPFESGIHGPLSRAVV